MNTARIDKLNVLLKRVRERRAEPRLLRIPGVAALESANTNLSEREGPVLVSTTAAPLAVQPEPPRAAAFVEPPAPRPTSSIQPAVLLESDAPAALKEAPPPLQLKTPSSTVPPAAPVAEPPARATTEVLPAAPVRVAPSPAVPFDSAVKVVSSPRIEAPKTFGELLELSLSLRPK